MGVKTTGETKPSSPGTVPEQSDTQSHESLITYEDAVTQLAEETDRSEETIRQKAQEEENRFNGLLSPLSSVIYAGRRHFDVDLIQDIEPPEPETTPIGQLQDGMAVAAIEGKIQRIEDAFTFTRKDGSDGHGRKVTVSDDTGTITLMLWGEKKTTAPDTWTDGDLIRIAPATVSAYKGSLQIVPNSLDEINVTPSSD